MLAVQNVTMRYGAKILFEDVTTTFNPGRRYGLSGPNGAANNRVYSEHGGAGARLATSGSGRGADVAAERKTVCYHGGLRWREKNSVAELEGVVADEDGYTAESDAAVLLDGLGIPEALHGRKMGELQGGQKVRVLLSQALFGNPQALLLDEPTNHLDLDSIHWLEEFLSRFKGTVIVISHDRHFLNNVCTHIADIDYQTIIQYTGGYDDMVMAKIQVRSRIESDNAQREKKIAQLNEFIQRFAAGTRSSQVNSRRKEVERLQPSDLARSNIQRPFIKFALNKPGGRYALEFEGVKKGYDTDKDGTGGRHEVIKGFSAMVQRGEKVALMGRNGIGKTTLLNALLANAPQVTELGLKLDGGEVKWGHEANVGYFSQDFAESIPKGYELVTWLHQFDPEATKGFIDNLKKGQYSLRDMSEMFKNVAKLGSMSQVRLTRLASTARACRVTTRSGVLHQVLVCVRVRVFTSC